MPTHEIMNITIPKAEITVNTGEVFSYPTHTHSYYEMTLYEPFDGGVTVNGEFFSVDEPAVFLLSPSDFHRITVNGAGSKFIKLGFHEKALNEMRQKKPDQPIILKPADKPLIIELFREILLKCDDEEYISVLISAAMRYLSEYGEAVQPAVSGQRHELAVKALRYANKNFRNDITLTDAAAEFAVSPQYLSAVFSKEVGIGFSAYVTDLRLRTAAELLKVSDKNITEVCFECGYRNLSHFLRSFKAKFGVSPKEYRKFDN